MPRGGSFGPGRKGSTSAKAAAASSSRSVTSTTGSKAVVACFATRCVPALSTVCASSATSTPRGRAARAPAPSEATYSLPSAQRAASATASLPSVASRSSTGRAAASRNAPSV